MESDERDYWLGFVANITASFVLKMPPDEVVNPFLAAIEQAKADAWLKGYKEGRSKVDVQ